MSKRFTETQKWQDSWFMDLPVKYKLAWLWTLDNCDHAGIVEANPRLMSFVIGEAIDGDEFIRVMNGRVTKPKLGKWFITKFIEFQYGDLLNADNSAHKGVLRKLAEAGIDCPVAVVGGENKAPAKPLPSPCQGAQDKDKDKDKDKDSEASQKKRKEPEPMPTLPDLINTTGMQEAWNSWIAFRASKKKPVSAFGAKQAMKDFLLWGVDASIKSINESKRNDWQGLFEPKGTPTYTQQHQPVRVQF